MAETGKPVRFTLNPDSGLPLYLQIAHEFIYRIESGMLRQNDPLPGIRKLAAELGISFLTVDKAYKWLRERGVVASFPGVGVRVQLTLAPTDEEVRERQRIERLAEKLVQLSIKEGLNPVLVAQAAAHHARAHMSQAKAPELLFVECHREFVDDYTAELKRALSEERVTIRGVLLDDLKQQLKHGPLELGETTHLSTTLYHFGFLQRAVAREGIQVVALSHTLDQEAARFIAGLDPDLKLGVLLGPVDPAPSIIQTIEFYRNQGKGTIPFAVVTDQPAARRLVRSSEVLAYTSSCQEFVRTLGDKMPRAIEVRFVPDQDAVNKIKLLLARQGQNGHR